MRTYNWLNYQDGSESLYSFDGTGAYKDSQVDGWIQPYEDGTWLARTHDGEVRESFPTYEEAKDFLWGICHMRNTS